MAAFKTVLLPGYNFINFLSVLCLFYLCVFVVVETQRRMQFWFNMSSVNTSEDLIECYFHIYKKRAPVIHSLKSHTVSVRYFIIEQIERFRFPR